MFSWLFGKKPEICVAEYEAIVTNLRPAMLTFREEFATATGMRLISLGFSLRQEDTIYRPMTMQNDILTAFQSVMAVGFSYRYGDLKDVYRFGEMLKTAIFENTTPEAEKYRESFLDCEGVWSLLSNKLSCYLQKSFSLESARNFPTEVFDSAAYRLAVRSQSEICRVAGDDETRKALLSEINL